MGVVMGIGESLWDGAVDGACVLDTSCCLEELVEEENLIRHCGKDNATTVGRVESYDRNP